MGEQKLYLRGVTYGTFRPSTGGDQYPQPEVVRADFSAMAANGINALRTYTVPPEWLLDEAAECGIYVLVGLPWEQHIAFLDGANCASNIEQRVREGIRRCAGHPAVLGYAIGNEIPASIVRWYGARGIERFLKRLYLAAKSEDPQALVTYVNYPTTEYLRLAFLDFYCFNVYLEHRDQLEAYLGQLQNLADDRPLILAEVGLDSRRNGEILQAEVLDWQIRTAFSMGAAGIFLFSWTDEWYRGGFDIDDWDFGLTRRDREAKPALAAVRSAFTAIPFEPDLQWPRISVVVCSYNGSRTIRGTLEGLEKLEYANYEVIVVDDGSTDTTSQIAAEYNVRLIRTPNRGLSAARNTGLEAATGSIVAYIDDDAWPDPHWLQYLGWTFLTSSYAGVGGPNIPPPGDGAVAGCVAHAPGGPVHVLISAREAEHIPGCNCAFRKTCLEAIGGFDPVFRVAGDDVDLCWRLQERGWALGFQPAAVVWHHRRNSVRTYLKQQMGYGKAESLLERKWPSKYNIAGHVTWSGRLYGRGVTQPLGRSRVYHGIWGGAPFQRLYEPAPGTAAWLMLMPEWLLVVLALMILVAMGVLWTPLRYAVIPLAIAMLTPMLYVAKTVAYEFNFRMPWRYRLLTIGLHFTQPVARLWGRIHHGLTPWRHRGAPSWNAPYPRIACLWSEIWHSSGEWLLAAEQALYAGRAVVTRGNEFDRWDLEIRGCLLGGIRSRLAIEDHEAGKQLLRFRSWPVFSPAGLGIVGAFSALSLAARLDHAPMASALLSALALFPAGWLLRGCARAQAAWELALDQLGALRLDRAAATLASEPRKEIGRKRGACASSGQDRKGERVPAQCVEEGRENVAESGMTTSHNLSIPFHRPSIGEKEISEVVATLRSGWLTTGPRTAQFEREFRDYVGAPHALGVNSCTAGLHLALAALKIGPGAEVITSPLTFCATVNTILHVGATPVLADVGPDGNIDPASIAERITEHTRAVIPVHLGGLPCDMDSIWSLARRHGLHVIEDAAHAIGSHFHGAPIGGADPATNAHSDVVAYSFYATKNVTTGEGGMVTTHDEALAEAMRCLCLHGISKDAWNRYADRGNWYYEVLSAGFKYNLSDIQSAIGLHQLRKLERSIQLRTELSRRYQHGLADVAEVEIPADAPFSRHAWHLYAIRLNLEHLEIDRAEFIRRLLEKGIGASVHFIPIPLHPFFAEYAKRPQNHCPRALALYPRLVSLPLYPGLTAGQVDAVVRAVKEIVCAAKKIKTVSLAKGAVA